MDIHSSWSNQEINPIVGRGTFGARQAAVSAGIIGGALAAEIVTLRKFPKMKKTFTIVNFAIAGTHGAAAVKNFKTD